MEPRASLVRRAAGICFARRRRSIEYWSAMTKRDPHAAASPVGHNIGNVAEFFDSFAAIYGKGRYFELRRAAVFEILAPYLDKAARILDLGCGNGIYLVELAKLDRPHRPVGMDLSAGHAGQGRATFGRSRRSSTWRRHRRSVQGGLSGSGDLLSYYQKLWIDDGMKRAA